MASILAIGKPTMLKVVIGPADLVSFNYVQIVTFRRVLHNEHGICPYRMYADDAHQPDAFSKSTGSQDEETTTLRSSEMTESDSQK